MMVAVGDIDDLKVVASSAVLDDEKGTVVVVNAFALMLCLCR